jgi:hypothetical protein
MSNKQGNEELYRNFKGEYNYHFNWIGGGFNDVWARDLDHFKEVVKERFPNSHPMVDYKTVRRVTQTEERAIAKMAFLMTC